MQQCDSDRSLTQTSAHYPKTSKPNDQTPTNWSIGTQSTSLIQEPSDQAPASLSAMTNRTGTNCAKTPLGTDPKIIWQQMMPLTHDMILTALTLWSLMITAVLLMAWKQRQVACDRSEDQGKTRTTNPRKPECHDCKWTMEMSYKSLQEGTSILSSQFTDTLLMPSAPNNSPTTSPCLLPTLTQLLRQRSEDSGSKEKLSTTLCSVAAAMTTNQLETVTEIGYSRNLVESRQSVTATCGVATSVN